MKNITIRAIKTYMSSLLLPSLCFASGNVATYNFSPFQSAIINFSFALGAVFLLLGFLVFKQAATSPGYYNKSTAIFLILSGTLLFSITYIACMFSRSILVTTQLNVSNIAINSQLANIDVGEGKGIYSILPTSTIKNVIGIIMLIGWYSFAKGLYHLGRSGYKHEKGHIKSAFTHIIAGIIAINIVKVGPWFISLLYTLPK